MGKYSPGTVPFFSFFIRFILGFFFLLGTPGCAEGPLSSFSKTSPKESGFDAFSLKDAKLFFLYVVDRLNTEYVEPLNHGQILEGALQGMLSNLDPHSAYLNPKQFKEIKKQTQGHYGGIGIEMVLENGFVRVISAIPDTPASRAGILTDDLIVKIDDAPVQGMNVIEAAEKMRGEPNTTLKLTIRRRQTEEFDLVLIREVISIKPVEWRVEDGQIGYIRIKTFNKETTVSLHRALKDLQEKLGEQLKGYILDLRDNPGGLLDQAVSVSDTFLTKGEIVSIRGRQTENVTRFEARSPDLSHGLPLAVLINGGSASASEIVAGALQDHHRAIIMGAKSFGKGSVQSVVPLRNGGALKITTALYYTPSGKLIQKQGIIPDVPIDQLVDLKTLNDKEEIRENSFPRALNPKEKARSNEENLKQINPSSDRKQQSQSKEDQTPSSSPIEKADRQKNPLLTPLKDYQLRQALLAMKTIVILSRQGELRSKKDKPRSGQKN